MYDYPQKKRSETVEPKVVGKERQDYMFCPGVSFQPYYFHGK